MSGRSFSESFSESAYEMYTDQFPRLVSPRSMFLGLDISNFLEHIKTCVNKSLKDYDFFLFPINFWIIDRAQQINSFFFQTIPYDSEHFRMFTQIVR